MQGIPARHANAHFATFIRSMVSIDSESAPFNSKDCATVMRLIHVCNDPGLNPYQKIDRVAEDLHQYFGTQDLTFSPGPSQVGCALRLSFSAVCDQTTKASCWSSPPASLSRAADLCEILPHEHMAHSAEADASSP